MARVVLSHAVRRRPAWSTTRTTAARTRMRRCSRWRAGARRAPPWWRWWRRCRRTPGTTAGSRASTPSGCWRRTATTCCACRPAGRATSCWRVGGTRARSTSWWTEPRAASIASRRRRSAACRSCWRITWVAGSLCRWRRGRWSAARWGARRCGGMKGARRGARGRRPAAPPRCRSTGPAATPSWRPSAVLIRRGSAAVRRWRTPSGTRCGRRSATCAPAASPSCTCRRRRPRCRRRTRSPRWRRRRRRRPEWRTGGRRRRSRAACRR